MVLLSSLYNRRKHQLKIKGFYLLVVNRMVLLSSLYNRLKHQALKVKGFYLFLVLFTPEVNFDKLTCFIVKIVFIII